MEVIYKSCCGIDVHKNKLVACLKIKGKKNVIKEFSGQTEDIKSMANWLLENNCEKVAMESTASFWKPLVNIFEMTNLDYTVINARDYKNLPGKKTDVLDSEWIADLLQHGMLRDSYIPTREQRELREATRYRKSLTQERTRGLNRLQKMLEGANIKITSILSGVLGVTSRNLIEYVLENDEETASGALEKNGEKALLWEAIRRLNDREQKIMELRFGLNGDEESTQKEVADMLGISQSYISRIEKKILSKLKKDLQKANIG